MLHAKEQFPQTGDVAVLTASEVGYRILGRSSVDIIKSGGEKISALEIERALLNLPGPLIKDAAVVAVPDERWGEAVGAVIVLSDKEGSLEVKQLREMLRGQVSGLASPLLISAGLS